MTGSAIVVQPTRTGPQEAPRIHDVAQAGRGVTVPLGLQAGATLLGGGASLLPTGLPMALGMEHQPDFVRAVAAACRDQALSGRDWYAHGAMALVGSKNSGRGHAARCLAAAAGLPLFIADASTPSGRALLTGDAAPGAEALPPFAVTAIAASRCANPIILVEGLRGNEDLAALLGPFIDPDRACRYEADRLGCRFDLGEVNWLLQLDSAAAADRIPPGWASMVPFRQDVGDAALVELSLIRAVARELDAAGLMRREWFERTVREVIRRRGHSEPIGQAVDRLVMELSSEDVW